MSASTLTHHILGQGQSSPSCRGIAAASLCSILCRLVYRAAVALFRRRTHLATRLGKTACSVLNRNILPTPPSNDKAEINLATAG
jgi:uncharacterized membrane protein (GlpM family)